MVQFGYHDCRRGCRVKRLLVILLCCLAVIGCGKAETVEVDKATKAIQNSSEAIEYTYSDLKDLCEKFWDEWLEETSDLNNVEWYGTSDKETQKNEHYYEIANKYASKVFENFEVPQGQKVIVSGYIGEAVSLDENTFFVQKGVGKVFFYLKHNAEDNKIDGITCRTDDEAFLYLHENTPVKIEAVFMKDGDMASNIDLYDCKILEKGEPVNVETNAPYPTAAIAQ